MLEKKKLVMEDETPEQEIVDELEGEINFLEEEFESVKDENDPTTREKQEKVEEILNEVHEQIDFLKEVSERQEK
ncbi:MAG: hypothetical protein BRC27_00935 [Nanohaloarchaea archaeon SW_10_44_10]|nr:MAG: hypothetical protein BRC27_00935 [Nanohaloarchaea archaeon SW_10_44_10]